MHLVNIIINPVLLRQLVPIDPSTAVSADDIVRASIRNILVALGDDPDREGLKETPDRVARMYHEIYEGMRYTNDEIAEMFNKCFEDVQTGDLVTVSNIPIFSTEFDRDNMFLFETEKDANNALYELQDFSEYLESISENDLSLDSDEYDSRLENILISNNAGDVDILGIVINSDGTAKISTPVEELSCKVINSDPVDLSY